MLKENIRMSLREQHHSNKPHKSNFLTALMKLEACLTGGRGNFYQFGVLLQSSHFSHINRLSETETLCFGRRPRDLTRGQRRGKHCRDPGFS